MQNRFLFLTLLVPVLCFHLGCKKEPDDKDGKWYVIPEGKHETTNPLTPRSQNLLVFKAEFNESAIYHSNTSENQADVNKLLGLSDCGTHHQTNSARFGWRWFNDSLQILAYCYVDGRRIEPVYITSVELNKFNVYHLSFEDGYYVFTVNHTTVKIPRGCNYTGLRYLLYPFFGGDEAAPHEIRIWIDEINPEDEQ